jgi:hypothetical protein
MASDGNDFLGHENADGHRQIQTGSFFFHVSGGKIDGDLLDGKRKAAILQRRTHPIATFSYRRVR